MFTNSIIPPSYLCSNSLCFLEFLSISFIQTPLFKKANSLILFSKIDELNLIEENISEDGRKVIFVPVFFVLPICLSGLTEYPSSKFISYSLPSLKIFNSSFFDKALTTETPTL